MLSAFYATNPWKLEVLLPQKLGTTPTHPRLGRVSRGKDLEPGHFAAKFQGLYANRLDWQL